MDDLDINCYMAITFVLPKVYKSTAKQCDIWYGKQKHWALSVKSEYRIYDSRINLATIMTAY